MHKKSVIAICITAGVICALVLSGRTLSKSSIQDIPSPVSNSDDLPAHVPYAFLFQHLKQLRKQADKQKRQGKDGSGFLRRFKDALVVEDQQFELINAVALQCETEVEELDSRAKTITQAFRTQYSPGRVPDGVTIPPPPAELTALQGMRTNAILRARDRMKQVLGEQDFARFDENVRLRLAPRIKPIGGQ